MLIISLACVAGIGSLEIFLMDVGQLRQYHLCSTVPPDNTAVRIILQTCQFNPADWHSTDVGEDEEVMAVDESGWWLSIHHVFVLRRNEESLCWVQQPTYLLIISRSWVNSWGQNMKSLTSSLLIAFKYNLKTMMPITVVSAILSSKSSNCWDHWNEAAVWHVRGAALFMKHFRDIKMIKQPKICHNNHSFGS